MVWTWLIKKLIEGFATLFLVASLTFFMMQALPGGPFDEDRKLPPEIKAQMEERYRLNDPAWLQYMHYMGNISHGDFGPSYKYLSRRVNDMVYEASLVSFRVGFLAIVLGVSTGVAMALASLMAPLKCRKYIDSACRFVGFGSMAFPNFVIAALLVLVFAYGLGILPAARLVSPLHLVLPVLTLSVTPFAYTFLLLRSSVQDVLHQKFVLVKRSAGLDENAILFKHVLRNALIPLIAILGPITAGILTGSFSVEVVFGLPGLGKYFVNAVTNRDYTVVMAITLLYSTLLIMANFAADILMGLCDPRIRQEASTS